MRVRGQLARLGIVMVLMLLVGLLAACGGQSGDAEVGDGAQTMNAQALLENRCTQCHGLDRVKSITQTEAEWEATVEDMIQRGAKLNDQEKQVLVDYLAQEYGP